MKRIGIIGCGNMGAAIAERIKSKYQVMVFDKDRNKTQNLSAISVEDTLLDLVKKSDVIILAVKPQDFDELLKEIKDYAKEKLVISIAAGIPTAYIEKYLGKAKVVRVMPNIGAKIGEAESSLCKGKNAKEKDLDFARELFDYLGKTWIVEEEMINAATAISGSGPAYIYYDMEMNRIDPLNVPKEIEEEYVKRLRRAAEKVGFDSQIAFELAVNTSATSLHLTAALAKSPAELINLIASKGGTTEEALKVLAKGGSWEEAALAAKKRAEELAKKEI